MQPQSFCEVVVLLGSVSSWEWCVYGQALKSHMPPRAGPEEERLSGQVEAMGEAPPVSRDSEPYIARSLILF